MIYSFIFMVPRIEPGASCRLSKYFTLSYFSRSVSPFSRSVFKIVELIGPGEEQIEISTLPI